MPVWDGDASRAGSDLVGHIKRMVLVEVTLRIPEVYANSK